MKDEPGPEGTPERSRPPDARSPDGRSPETVHHELALAELVDRVLDRGVVVTGEVVIGLAGVDLVYLGVDLVLSSVERLRRNAVTRPQRDDADHDARPSDDRAGQAAPRSPPDHA